MSQVIRCSGRANFKDRKRSPRVTLNVKGDIAVGVEVAMLDEEIEPAVAKLRPAASTAVRCRNRILFESEEVQRIDGECRAFLRASDDRAIHIRNILKLDCGDFLKTGVVDGGRATSTISEMQANGDVQITFLDETWEPALPRLPVDVLLALPRPKVANRLWPILASLGVRSVYVTGAEKVEKAYWGAKSMDPLKVRHELKKGLEQSSDTVLPRMVFCRRLKKMLAWLDGTVDPRDAAGGSTEGDGIFAPKEIIPGDYRSVADARHPVAMDDEGEAQLRLLAHPGTGSSGILCSVKEHCANIPSGSQPTVLIAVGPEGGWADSELEMLALSGFQKITLGERPLATSTACVALIASAAEIIKEASCNSIS